MGGIKASWFLTANRSTGETSVGGLVVGLARLGARHERGYLLRDLSLGPGRLQQEGGALHGGNTAPQPTGQWGRGAVAGDQRGESGCSDLRLHPTPLATPRLRSYITHCIQKLRVLSMMRMSVAKCGQWALFDERGALDARGEMGSARALG
jgi:hypothetical protein